MKKWIVEYEFLNTNCSFESADLFTFVKKLNWIEEQAEILPQTVVIRTEAK